MSDRTAEPHVLRPLLKRWGGDPARCAHDHPVLQYNLRDTVAPGSEYSVLVLDREWRSRTASRWRGERGAGP